MIETQLVEAITMDDIKSALRNHPLGNIAAVRQLIAARDIALGRKQFDPSVLIPLKEVVETGSKTAVELASLVLMTLAVRFAEARALIEQLAGSKTVKGRVGAIFCLSVELPTSFLDEILQRLAFDKSKRVRELAVDWIGRNGLKEFVPLLQSAESQEADPLLKGAIYREISLLDKGFFVLRENESIYVTVALPGGQVAGFVKASQAPLSDSAIVDSFLKERDLGSLTR